MGALRLDGISFWGCGVVNETKTNEDDPGGLALNAHCSFVANEPLDDDSDCFEDSDGEVENCTPTLSSERPIVLSPWSFKSHTRSVVDFELTMGNEIPTVLKWISRLLGRDLRIA